MEHGEHIWRHTMGKHWLSISDKGAWTFTHDELLLGSSLGQIQARQLGRPPHAVTQWKVHYGVHGWKNEDNVKVCDILAVSSENFARALRACKVEDKAELAVEVWKKLRATDLVVP